MFAGRHLRGAISGQVPDVSGTVVVADDAGSTVEITLGGHSADFGSDLWNDVVRGHDLLGASTHPVARYGSRKVNIAGATLLVDGALELNGHCVNLPLSVCSEPLGRCTARFTTTAVLDRRAFGLRCDLPVVGRDRLIAREIRLQIGLVARRVG